MPLTGWTLELEGREPEPERCGVGETGAGVGTLGMWWVATSGAYADATTKAMGWWVANRTQHTGSSYEAQTQDHHFCSLFTPV